MKIEFRKSVKILNSDKTEIKKYLSSIGYSDNDFNESNFIERINTSDIEVENAPNDLGGIKD